MSTMYHCFLFTSNNKLIQVRKKKTPRERVGSSKRMSNYNEYLEKLQSSLTSNYSNSGLNTNNNSYSNSKGLTTKQEDELITWAEDLVTPDYRLWFVKQLKRVGKARFVECATAAKKYDGVSRQKVFTSLLKNS